ncbi:hypothetical protein BCAMP_07220 [Brochothrix campestris FSL F6-1037]|uniref:Uncharacterized protein n=1 Tax=Brochothrix campestris FSL F6-1037 TaxID=1265861 RepID=W7CQS1_9LIST|nr:hypothetical protein BCAMP_07220 [Brochothrix campestris FSL F6-1037]
MSVSFETTKCRHLEGLRVNEFSIEQMEQWWIAEDLLDYKSEMLVDGEVEQTDLIEQVMNYIKDN